jgi:hypothetical protein
MFLTIKNQPERCKPEDEQEKQHSLLNQRRPQLIR